MSDVILPVDWQDFRYVVLDRIKAYCRAGIWPWEYDLFTNWLANFECSVDEYVALHILDSLIVRSQKMAEAGFSRLFNSELLQYLINKEILSKSINLKEWSSFLRQPRNSPIKFVPVRMEGDEGESGGAIFRQLSSLISTNELSKKTDKTKALVLIDDLLGSGDQIKDFMHENDLVKSELEVIYCPLIAYDEGMKTISRLIPTLKIMPVEKVNSEHSLFSTSPRKFRNDPINSVKTMSEHYKGMKRRYASKNMPFWMGRDDSALPIAFEWGCPNQAPSILWMQNSPVFTNWRQLFHRRA